MNTQAQTPTADREAIPDAANPLGLDGIEFIEYTTSKPQALGQVLEMMGFRPVARHRSREVLLYRQGAIEGGGSRSRGRAASPCLVPNSL